MRRVLAWEECAKKETERSRRHSVEDEDSILDQGGEIRTPDMKQLPRSGRSNWFKFGRGIGGWGNGGWRNIARRNNANTGGRWG